jgi:hypothetical protein
VRAAVGLGALAAAALVSVASASSLAASSGRLAVDRVGTCTALAAADAYVDQSLLSAGSSFGTEQTLSVRSQSLANRRAFVRFDLSPCSIPPSANVTDAELRLIVTSAPGSNRTHAAHRVTVAWTETTTWDSQPAVAAAASASAATATSAGATVAWASATLLADVRGWVDGTLANHGWRISDGTEDALVAAEVGYGAREHSTATSRPHLFVVYEP